MKLVCRTKLRYSVLQIVAIPYQFYSAVKFLLSLLLGLKEKAYSTYAIMRN